MTNGQAIFAELDEGVIRYMTWVLLWDAPHSVFDRWYSSIGTVNEFAMRQSTWRIILQVEAATR